MLEDDLYNAEHKSNIGNVWPLSMKTKEFKNDSDSEDEKQYVNKSGNIIFINHTGFYRDN